MKRIISVLSLLLVMLMVTSCAYRGSKYPPQDLANEHWQGAVETSAEPWKKGASQWFLTGNPQLPKKLYKDGFKDIPVDGGGMTTMMVDAPYFTKITVEGPFQIQLFGTYKRNSVYLFGPNSGVRAAVVELKGDTLCIRPAKGAKNTADMQRVIIRIGVTDLRQLVNSGQGQIEARELRSSGLQIDNRGSGNLYLAGHFRANGIKHTGIGCLNLFGAESPMLNIDTNGKGKVNVAGNVGLHSIKHTGSEDINIIGALGGHAKINTSGSGKIGIYGYPNIAEINAGDTTCVYSYSLQSDSLNVYTSRNACVGLAGATNNLFVNADGNSRFEGRYLQSSIANVRANQRSHINVSASKRIFAAATGNGSVYYFGSPDKMSQFISGNGVVMPIWYPGVPAKANTVWKDSPSVKVYKKAKRKKPSSHQSTRQYKKKNR